MVIVYRSNTGFTKEYAEMLAKAEKMKVCPLSEAQGKVGPGETVFFMGPLMAGHISGVDQAVKKFAVKGVCGVGMSPASQQVLDTLAKANYVPGAPIFYPRAAGPLKRWAGSSAGWWAWPPGPCGRPSRIKSAPPRRTNNWTSSSMEAALWPLRIWRPYGRGSEKTGNVLSGSLAFEKENARPDESPCQGEMSRSDKKGRERAHRR